ncbi:MAG: hypothetical protein AAFO03_17890, partial [Bacteroidota bacterium]
MCFYKCQKINPELELNVLRDRLRPPHICIVSRRYEADEELKKLLFYFQRKVEPKQISTKILTFKKGANSNYNP